MPTYTYRCTKCGDEIEVVQSMTDPPLKRCKRCRGAIKRTFHPVGIVLKGPGFHRTDYRSPAKKSSGESSKDAEKGSSEKSSTDTKEKKASSGSKED